MDAATAPPSKRSHGRCRKSFPNKYSLSRLTTPANPNNNNMSAIVATGGFETPSRNMAVVIPASHQGGSTTRLNKEVVGSNTGLNEEVANKTDSSNSGSSSSSEEENSDSDDGEQQQDDKVVEDSQGEEEESDDDHDDDDMVIEEDWSSVEEDEEEDDEHMRELESIRPLKRRNYTAAASGVEVGKQRPDTMDMDGEDEEDEEALMRELDELRPRRRARLTTTRTGSGAVIRKNRPRSEGRWRMRSAAQVSYVESDEDMEMAMAMNPVTKKATKDTDKKGNKKVAAASEKEKKEDEQVVAGEKDVCVPCQWLRQWRKDKTCSGGSPCEECKVDMKKRGKEWQCYYTEEKVKQSGAKLPDIYRSVHDLRKRKEGTVTRRRKLTPRAPSPSPPTDDTDAASPLPAINSAEDPPPTNTSVTSVRGLHEAIKHDIKLYQRISAEAVTDGSLQTQEMANEYLSRIIGNDRDAELLHYLFKEDEIKAYNIPENMKKGLIEANLQDCLEKKQWRGA